MAVEVVHDESGSRFVAVIEGEEAVVEYRPLDGRVLDVYRTYVPDVARGQGLAGTLMRATLDHARGEGYRVIPSCSYAVRFFEKHPEYADLRA